MSGGASVHLDSQYDVSTVSNTPDTSHTDHITDFNNKFRFVRVKGKNTDELINPSLGD